VGSRCPLTLDTLQGQEAFSIVIALAWDALLSPLLLFLSSQSLSALPFRNFIFLAARCVFSSDLLFHLLGFENFQWEVNDIDLAC